MKSKTKKSNSKRTSKGPQSSHLSSKPATKFDALADKMDNFVERQDLKTKNLIDKLKSWDKELNQIYSKYQDTSKYHQDLGAHMKQRKKNIEIGKKAILTEQFKLNQRQLYYISQKFKPDQKTNSNINTANKDLI